MTNSKDKNSTDTVLPLGKKAKSEMTVHDFSDFMEDITRKEWVPDGNVESRPAVRIAGLAELKTKKTLVFDTKGKDRSVLEFPKPNT